jgi:hypothetical protein
MRARDPHEDPPTKRRPETHRRPPITLGQMRSHAVKRLLIYCSAGLDRHHSAVGGADRRPDDTAMNNLCRRAVCTKFGIIGADLRPDWDDRPKGARSARSGDEPSATLLRHGGMTGKRCIVFAPGASCRLFRPSRQSV